MSVRRFVEVCVLILFVLIASPRHAAAQQAGTTVSGFVINTLTGELIADATVALESPAFTEQAVTGADGAYSMAGVPPGEYHLIVRRNEFLQSRMDLTVGNAPRTVDVQLDPELHFSEVTAVTPEGRSTFESFQSSDVVGGQDLTQALGSTIGATLQEQPGVTTRSFGPGPSRPVIRGMDGDRVLVTQDGLRLGDLSSQSGDHGINVNPASADSIEVIRGPATLLYGANAIGGLVNVVTNDIPKFPVTRTTGSLTIDAASAAPGGGGAGDVTVGNGAFALHLSGSGRRATNFRTPDGEVANSFSRAGAAEVGAGYTSDNGYVGASFGYDRTHYGIPFVEEGETNLDPRQKNFTVRGERRSMGGFFDGLRGSFGVRRYNHDELDGDEIATSFVNNTTELEFLAHHRRTSRMSGSIGGQVLTRDFSAAGEEALSPEVSQHGGAAYIYEEVTSSLHTQVQFGGRVEYASFTPKVDEPARDFTTVSGSVGFLVFPTDRTTIALSLAHASRNPALEELYFHGEHAGNNAIENGDPNLGAERATGFDASFRWRSPAASGEVTVFLNQIDNFIYRQYTGEVDDESGLADTFYAQADGRMTGVESHVDTRIAPVVWVEGGLDYVRGQFTSFDSPMPRIPPLRGKAGIRVQRKMFQAGVEGTFTGAQHRVFALESEGELIGDTPTDGYSLLKLYTSYSFVSSQTVSTITVRLDNATSAVYHNHLNYIKDLVPEMGRNFAVVYNVKF